MPSHLSGVIFGPCKWPI